MGLRSLRFGWVPHFCITLMYPVSDMAQGLLQVLGVQHDTLNEELQRVRQVTLLQRPCAKGQGYSDFRYSGEQVRRRYNQVDGKLRLFKIVPLFRRLAENSKLQSQVKYHAEFEAAKGKFTQIADDPETERIKANSQVIRLVF